MKAIGSRLFPNLEDEFVAAPELLNELMQCSKLPRWTENPEAFAEAYLYFFSICLGKKSQGN